MDLIKPRERILKKVRAALIGRSDAFIGLSAVPKSETPTFKNPTESLVQLLNENGHLAFLCNNKYDFIDKLLGHLQNQPNSSIVCNDSKIQAYLDSCGKQYYEEQTISAGITNVLCTATLAVAETGTIALSNESDLLQLEPRIYVINQDQVIAGIKTLFEKLKYRHSVGEDKTLSILQPTNIIANNQEGQMAFFILKDNK